jgi:NADPH-dependent 2,4-dienoyl-CoA reductase/sulfur reductase-like enzyme
LVSVCVIGGGTAGEEAAFEAGLRGAAVTIVERRNNRGTPWRSWPELISHPGENPRPVDGRRDSPPLVLTAEVRSAGPGYVVLTRGDRLHFDFIIVTTGARFGPVGFPGFRKAGVIVLDGEEDYAELGRASSSADRIIVVGEGYRGLEVAERLSGKGAKVLLLISCWQRSAPSQVALEVIEDVARDEGVEVRRGDVTKAVGNGRVEAAVAGGSVFPCDILAVVPPRAPSPIHSQLKLGRNGGVAVDGTMRTSESTMFAAGGCAELNGEALGSGSLDAEPSRSGRIAGSNCMGSRHSIGETRVDELHVFGLRWSRVRKRAGAGGAFGRPVEIVSRRWGQASACAIAHEKTSERVVLVESIQPSASSPAGLPPLVAGVTLEALAYGLGSSDISPISETARLGLREWPRS